MKNVQSIEDASSTTSTKTTSLGQQKSPGGNIPTRLMMNADTEDIDNSIDRTFSTLVRELEKK